MVMADSGSRIIFGNFKDPIPKTLHVQFGYTWYSGFREEDFE